MARYEPRNIAVQERVVLWMLLTYTPRRLARKLGLPPSQH
jgi:hypothetical protein